MFIHSNNFNIGHLMKKIITFSILILMIISGAAVAEKKVTQKAAAPTKSFEHSGFLGNYDGFKVINEKTGAEVWIKPPHQDLSLLKEYDSIIITPIEVWLHSAADYQGVNPADLKKITDYFTKALEERLGKNFKLVNEPGPNVMDLRIAVTGVNMERAKIKTHFKAHAAVEMEVRDSQSGDRLVAAIDKRSSFKLKEGEGSESYERALNYWAKIINTRLNQARSS